MTDKVYPMYESYDQAATQLLELIEARDYLAASLKNFPPHRLRSGQKMLAETNEKIEACEAALAAEYEAHQKTCRSKEELDNLAGELAEGMDAAFIYIKHCLPHEFERVRATLFNGWTPEEIEEFEDRIAILETTRLEEFVGAKKDL